LGIAEGGYVGHGETYLHPQDILWWSKGGVLHGQSAPRIKFLRQIIEGNVQRGLEPLSLYDLYAAHEGERYYIFYLGEHQPAAWNFPLPEGKRYRCDILDPWKMTITTQVGMFSGASRLVLPGKPYLALQFREVI
jgi:hypothetical protein